MQKPIVHHIPVCPFSQRLEIMLALKGRRDAVTFSVVDITRPRSAELLKLSGGSTALPILETADGVLKESLVILRYFDEIFPETPIARATPYERAVENMLIAMEGDFTSSGYRLVMNQDPARRVALHDAVLAQYRRIEAFLATHNPDGTFLFDRFGLAEAVFTPMFVRFSFLEYFEAFDLPAEGYERVRRWRAACLAHPAAQQVSSEEVVKAYYDYARGAGNGALPMGRTLSSFVFEPSWRVRPWPPKDKYGPGATDAELGLVAAG
ncbi:glutathione S-transferase family protein [Devosia sp. ZB163]|uniref:glutathione S-transferase family protein n=1 Tax=Devosia sp. ZB163 TaxID=3025938 RepID=UPI002361A7DD|nr:glutathione S-transferase family protein [Devosia sp. ZB163]MDC9822114.1 glutathione S-transferase family protein [Devosia sp. ZB163]